MDNYDIPRYMRALQPDKASAWKLMVIDQVDNEYFVHLYYKML